MTHPLALSFLEVHAAAACLIRKAGSHREHERVRDALADLSVHVNEVVVRDVAQGHGDLTVAVFEDVVRRAHQAGLKYPDMVAAFNRAQGSE